MAITDDEFRKSKSLQELFLFCFGDGANSSTSKHIIQMLLATNKLCGIVFCRTDFHDGNLPSQESIMDVGVWNLSDRESDVLNQI